MPGPADAIIIALFLPASAALVVYVWHSERRGLNRRSRAAKLPGDFDGRRVRPR